MDIYIKTAGFAIEAEYDWFRITPEGNLRESPPILLDCKVESLIQGDAFSVVIARHYEQLLLMVGGMESSRCDFNQRRIHNYVAWVGHHTDEPSLRTAAASALQGRLNIPVDEAIVEDQSGGFNVSFEKLKAVVTKLSDQVGNEPPHGQAQWGTNSNELRIKLAKELMKCRLPEQDGPLLVVTGIVDSQKLQLARVWRALTTTIEDRRFTPIAERTPPKKSRISAFFSSRPPKMSDELREALGSLGRDEARVEDLERKLEGALSSLDRVQKELESMKAQINKLLEK